MFKLYQLIEIFIITRLKCFKLTVIAGVVSFMYQKQLLKTLKWLNK